MKNITLFSFFIFLSASLFAQHTFSIVAIDEATGKIGAAGATCLTSADCGGCGGAVIISDIIPGKGAINAQATVCIPNINLNNGINNMDMGANAEEVLDWLLANDACQFGTTANRQYGIVTNTTADGITAMGYTGADCLDEANHIVGPNYSIQGNILIGTYVLDSIEAGFLNTNGTFEEKLMAAIQGANIPGADSRCLQDGISSKSSFLRIAEPDDSPGNFTIDLVVPATDLGVDPLDSLQRLFNELGISNIDDIKSQLLTSSIIPNPSKGDFVVSIESIASLGELTFLVFDLKGTLIIQQQIGLGQNGVSLDSASGSYIYQIKEKNRGVVDQGILIIQKN